MTFCWGTKLEDCGVVEAWSPKRCWWCATGDWALNEPALLCIG